MSVTTGKILPPYKKLKGSSVLDWEELTRLYLDQKQTAKDFIKQFHGIDVTKPKATNFLKRWETLKNKTQIKTYDIRKHVQKLADNEHVHEKEIKKRIKFLKSRQNLMEWEATEAVKHSIMTRVESKETSIQELGVMSKSLEIIFKLQRIALDMPVEGKGQAKVAALTTEAIAKAEAKARNSALEGVEEIPTYVVEMNDNGKFKTLKPKVKI